MDVNEKGGSKLKKLLKILKGHQSMLVAYSGGVDSTFLLACAKRALGDNVVAVTATSPIHAKDDLKFAKAMASELKARHVIVETNELSIKEFTRNDKDRCYYCKKEIFRHILQVGKEEGVNVVAHAITMDDLGDYRPGIKAAEELGMIAPLLEAGFTKKDVRANLKRMGIVGWDKPPSPCLATRIPYGQEITLDKLGQIHKAERFIKSLGQRLVRVRHWGKMAVVELDPKEVQKFLDPKSRAKLIDGLKALNFEIIAIDLEGYKTGKLNAFLGGEIVSKTKLA